MHTFTKITLALMAAAFISSTPVIAADNPLQEAVSNQKTDLSTKMKDNVSNAVEKAKGNVDTKSDELQKSLGAKKGTTLNTGKQEVLDVQQETVTVETPTGAAQETTTVITPEAPATPATPAPTTK